MNNNIFENLGITKKQVRIFLCTSMAMFIMMSLQYLGVHAPINPVKLITPFPLNSVKSTDSQQIQPKLEKNANDFKLKNTSSQFITKTYAATAVDNADAYTVVDLDSGEIIAEKNGDKRLPIASLTKVMTSVVALDLVQPSELFTITKEDARVVPTKIGVIPGQKMNLEELLHGMLLVSGNDAAETVKNGVDDKYHDNIFIKAMNQKAAFLGLTNTSFANPQGFDDPNNYSSADDLAILAHYALTNYPLIASIAQEDYHFLPANQNHKQFDMYNWNGLLDVYPNIQGLKIGNTGDAGMTTIVTANRGGKRLAAIVLGAPRIIERDLWAAQLLDLGYQKTLNLPPVNVTEAQLAAKYSTWKLGK